MIRSRRALALAAIVVAGCAQAAPAPSVPTSAVPATAASSASIAARPSSPAAASAAASTEPAAMTADDWAKDLESLDKGVRSNHPNPFVNHPQSEWAATLAALPAELAGATPDQQLVRLSRLVGLLDTHSWINPPFALHAYDVLPYPFADGWFVTAAKDPSLAGSRLVSISGVSAEDVADKLRPLIPSDNEMGDLDGIQGPMVFVEWLTGLGVVKDAAKPGFVFERPDGSRTTVDLTSTEEPAWEGEFNVLGDLNGSAPEAVARRGEAAWARLDKPTKTFVLSYNDYESTLLPKALREMKQALDDGSATRVVLDMRYLRGGNGSLATPLINALAADKRINRPGGLTILIGRENVSAGTLTASILRDRTKAVFVGEPTPARSSNFLCSCSDILLPRSGFTVTVPTAGGGSDPRDAIRPDLPMPLKSKDFFAGKDPVLDAVLAGAGSSPAP